MIVGNLKYIDDNGWIWKPRGGDRSIGGVVRHVGSAKYIYHSYAFGDGSVTWSHPLAHASNAKTMNVALRWLRDAHRLFAGAVASLDDADLQIIKPTHWGERCPVRVATDTMIQHDVFHAGEINHIRALMQGNDRWGCYR